MQLACPECGEQIPAENINIQEMAAVCPACNTVFQFEVPEQKMKRRKVKKPVHMTLQDDLDRLHMAFRTNFRLDKDENFIGSAIGGFAFTLVTIIIMGGYFVDDIPFILPIIFGIVAMLFYYWLGLTIFNKTHIEMDDERIRVSRKPIPGLFNELADIDLSGIVSIGYEETAISKREGYDTPRYVVWAETADGRRKTIVNDVIDDYAYFIAQRLQEHLDTGIDVDVSRLDVEQVIDADEDLLDALQASPNVARH